MTVSDLLERVAALRDKQKTARKAQALDFNFFTSVGRLRDEIRHSRFLESLLNPRGKHGRDSVFLKLFLEELGIAYSSDLDKWRVEREFTFSDGRRIDVLLTGPDQVVGIEVKVYSGEGKDQLEDYAASLFAMNPNSTLVFLTPHGRAPDAGLKLFSNRFENGDGPQVLCCSFAGAQPSMHRWVSSCLEEVGGLPHVAEVLRQYLDVLNRVEGNTLSRFERVEVAKLLTTDAGRFEAAQAIAEALGEARMLVQEAFWSDLAMCLKDEGLRLLPREESPQGGQPKPRLDCVLADRPLSGEGLVLRLEVLTYGRLTDRLSYKLQWRDPASGTPKETADETETGAVAETAPTANGTAPPNEKAKPDNWDEWAKALRAKRPKMESSKFSLVTGFLLIDNEKLDLTNLTGKALELADEKARRDITQKIAAEAKQLLMEADEIMRKSSPSAA